VSDALSTAELFTGGFGVVFDAFADAQEVTDILGTLAQYQGAPASPLYDAIQTAGHAGDLPALVLDQNSTWNCSNVTNCGWQPQPTATIAVSSAFVWESEGRARVRVYLGTTSLSDITVSVTTVPDTALEAFDFEAVETEVVIPAQSFSASAEIPIPIDDLDEPSETFFVRISSEVGGYTIPQPEATVTIYDGAPSNLTDVAPDQLAVVGLCVDGVGRPGEIASAGCAMGLPVTLPLSVGNADAADVKIDLAVTCVTADSSCSPLQRDWLVHFWLVARDGGDVLQSETPMGDYIYGRESLQLDTQPPSQRPVLVALHSAAVVDAMDEAERNGWDLEIEVRIGPSDDLLTRATDIPDLTPVPSLVIAGETSVNVRYVHAAAYGILPGEADDGKYVGTLTQGEIDLAGLYVPLSDDHVGLIAGETGVALPVGAPFVVVLPDVDENGDPVPVLSFLHREGWPFLFGIAGGRITATGVELDYDGMLYAQSLGYSTQDPRYGGNVHSNDAFYRGVGGQGTLTLRGDGTLDGSFSVGAGSGHTAFPKADVSWGGFTQTIEQSAIASQASFSITSFALDQSTSCRDADCLERGVRRLSVRSPSAAIDPRGFVVAAASTLAASPAGWGARAGGGPLAWERPDDWDRAGAPATLALPGYRLSRIDPPSQQLLAHLERAPLEPASLEHVVHSLGSVDNADGNFFPTGVSFGPEIYRDADGVPDLGDGQDPTGNGLRIDNDVDVISLDTSIAAKYVVRNAGVTGVFNADPSAVASPVTFYGYNLELTRFAVRVVDNQLDTYNWVDGSLVLNGDLGGPGGFDLQFSNLEIDCGARLGRANLAFEACNELDDDQNGVVDENCDHRLWAWNTDAETFSMAFDGEGICSAGGQQLVLQQQVAFGALDGPVGIEGHWDSNGALTAHQTQLQNAYRLDERDLERDGEGFAIRPDAALFEVADVPGWSAGRYGWLAMTDTLVGVPFWSALESDLRVANRLSIGQPTAEPTVMTNAGKLGALDSSQTNGALQQDFIDNGPKVWASYAWGNTGIGFELPVYYSPWQFNREQSKFQGLREEIDLFVLDAGAGIDFIEPTRTKLSFGASADFAKLKGVRFQVDLENPESLRAVDDLLVGLRILDEPALEPALSGLQEDVGVLNRLANKGLDEAMQVSLETALEELGAAAGEITLTGEDPIVTVSKAMAQLKSYPQQVVMILDDEVRGPIDAALAAHENELRNELLAFEEQLSPLQFGDPVPQSVFDTLDDARRRLGVIDESVTAVNDTISEPLDELKGLVASIAEPVARVDEAAQGIEQMLLQAVSFATTACETGEFSGGEGSGYIGDAMSRLTSVRDVFDLLESEELLDPLTLLLENDPELRARLEATQRDIKAKTEELTGFLDEAEQALRDQICDPRIDEVLTESRLLVGEIRTGAGEIDAFLSAAKAQIDRVGKLPNALFESVIVPVQRLDVSLASLRERLDEARDSFDKVDGDALLAEVDAELEEATGGVLTAIVLGDGESGTDVLTLAFDVASRGTHAMLDDVSKQLKRSVENLLPGAFFKPEELRRMLVQTIMKSAPVDDLRREMETHLAEINYRVNELMLQFIDQLNLGIQGALAGVESEVNDALETALAPVRNIPLESAKLDGFGVIAGNELERAHIAAEWTMSPAADGQEGNTFGASLDAVSWSASDKAASCGEGVADGRLDVTIAALGIPAKVAGSEIILKKVYLGFNLANNLTGLPPLTVRGVYGGLTVTGDISFAQAIVYDPAFAVGIGDVETYLGASAGALFSDIQAEVAFLVGRTCNDKILLELDPKVAKYIELPPTGFAGLYLRGGASIPLLTLGCPLTVGVGAEFGSWVLAGPPLTIGGLIGGAAYGKVACVGAIRGQIRALGQVNTDGDWMFSGEGFGAAGVGWCEPSSWTTRARSRDDDWCATADAQFRASFDGQWSIPAPEIGAVY